MVVNGHIHMLLWWRWAGIARVWIRTYLAMHVGWCGRRVVLDELLKLTVEDIVGTGGEMVALGGRWGW